MYKLNQHSLTRGVWFEPETQSMTLAERNTVSSITLGPDAPEIGFNDWILDEDWPEGPTVWRVKSIDDQTDSKTVTVSLEHVIRLLEDIKLFEAVETGDISGGDYCTARQAIEYLLAQQSDWVLGDLRGDDVSLPYEFSGGDSLFDAVESVSDTLEDAEWWYDLSRYPFVLHIRKRNSSVMSEMRGERNLSTLRRNISRSGMYTRIWPVGYNDLHISGAYLSKNESLYGRVDKVETNQGKTSEDSLRAWARAMLRKHCEPNVTITISGLELSQETGEPLDWIQLNRVCRCPLPEFHTTILERVIKIAWRDRRKDPESVTVTLGNNAADVQDLTKTVSETSKSSGSAARGQAKQNYLFEANGEHLLYEVFDECGHLHGVLRMTEQSLRVAFENLNECTRSEFYMTSESLRVQFENDINSTRSEFQMTSESLRVTFENEINSTRSQIEATSESLRTQFENEINSTRSEFQMTSESLRVTFENEINSTRLQIEATSESLRSTITDTSSGLQTQIDQNKESINLRVSKDDVGTQLAVELENVSITGGNLVVDGYVTSAGLDAAIGQIHDTYAQNISTNTFSCVTGSARDFTVYGTFKYKSSEEADPVSVLSAICGIGTAQESGGQFSIPTTTVGGSAGPSINFNIAASQTYIDGVAAARRNGRADMGLEADSENGVVKVVQGSTKSLTITATEPEFTYNSSGHYYRATASAKAGSTVMHTATSLTHSGTQAYLDGKTDGHGEMGVTADTETGKVKAAQSSTKELTITATAPTFSYSATTHKYTATAKAKAGSTEMHTATAVSGTEAYLAGWNAACDAITRNGNSIIGPKKDALGETETKYTAKYTASSYTKSSYTPETYEYLPSSYTASSYTKETHSYTASKYTASTYSASSYTKETHSYTASSHSHTSPSYKLNSGRDITISGSTTLNLSGDNTVQISAGSDSYTASKHSYHASSYTASSYTASTYTASKHSYTASSYTASKYTAEYMSYVKSSYTASSYTASSFTWE